MSAPGTRPVRHRSSSTCTGAFTGWPTRRRSGPCCRRRRQRLRWPAARSPYPTWPPPPCWSRCTPRCPVAPTGRTPTAACVGGLSGRGVAGGHRARQTDRRGAGVRLRAAPGSGRRGAGGPPRPPGRRAGRSGPPCVGSPAPRTCWPGSPSCPPDGTGGGTWCRTSLPHPPRCRHGPPAGPARSGGPAGRLPAAFRPARRQPADGGAGVADRHPVGAALPPWLTGTGRPCVPWRGRCAGVACRRSGRPSGRAGRCVRRVGS